MRRILRIVIPAIAVFALFQLAIPVYAEEAQPFNPSLFPEDPTRRPEKKPVDTSQPTRLVDNGDGTVTDPQTGLMWCKSDSYQLLKKWLNWTMAQEYLAEMNQNQFAGHHDWRLPTREEIQTLYDETKTVQWTYYWNTYDVHIDPIFGETGCCFWTSESYQDQYAWGFNFIRGKTYMSLKGGAQYSLSVIRPVRTASKNQADIFSPVIIK